MVEEAFRRQDTPPTFKCHDEVIMIMMIMILMIMIMMIMILMTKGMMKIRVTMKTKAPAALMMRNTPVPRPRYVFTV